MDATTTEIIARAVVRRDDRILLVRERVSFWSFLPGGHVEPGERVEVALVRELAEELDVRAEIVAFVGVVENGYVAADGTHHEINLVFEVSIDTADPVSSEEHLEFHWLPVGELGGADVRPSVLRDALVTGGSVPFWRAWAG